MKNDDRVILAEAARLETLACADYNSSFNILAKSQVSDKLLALLHDELKIVDNLKTIIAARFGTEGNDIPQTEVDKLLNQISSSDFHCR